MYWGPSYYRRPEPLRESGVVARTKNNTFELTAGPVLGRRRLYKPAWRGTVLSSSADGGGSRVVIEAGPAGRMALSYAIFAIWVAFICGFAVYRNVFPLSGAVLLFGAVLVMTALTSGAGKDLAKGESEALLDVLRQLIEVPAPATVPDSRH